MIIIFGYIVTILSVVGGFVLAGGHVVALWQPIEVLMIAGSAAGAFVSGTSTKKIKKTGKAIIDVFGKSSHTPEAYSQLLILMYELIVKSKKDGMIALEADCENPKESPLFTKQEFLVKNHPYAILFITDYLRLIVSGNSNAIELESLMDHEIVTAKHEHSGPAHVVAKIGDGLPAFGIVAAVIGVIHTMGSVGSAPPAELGRQIAAALVGTFLGILLSYGFIGPIAGLIEQKTADRVKMLECIKVIILAMLHNYSAPVAVEFGRKSLFSSERPEFDELENLIKESKLKAGK